MGVGPVPSTEKALARTGLSIEDIGLFELNEAFAVQVLAFLDHFGIADDDERVNPWGGAIAVGHPLASSGVRLMTQLSRQFAERPDVRYGLTAMCVGLGMGATVIWENPNWEGARQVTAVFENEVVTAAKVRYLRVPGLAGELALITIDNGHDHTRPSTFGPGGLASLDAALDEIAAPLPRPRGDRRDRQAVHLRRRRRPLRRPVGDRRRAGTGDRRGRAPGVPPPQGLVDPDVRLRQRRGARRRPGAGAALPLPDDRHDRGRRLPRGLPRPGARLGRHAAAAEPDRHRPGGHRDRRERAGAEQDARPARRRRSSASPTPSSSRPTSSSARWSGRPACVGGDVAVAASRGRPLGLGRRDRAGDGDRRRPHPQRLPRRAARGRAARPGPGRRRRRRVHRRHRGRGRRPRPTCS